MEKFRRALAAIDMGAMGREVTSGSRKALERAAWVARRVGASLTVLHSDKPDEHWDPETKSFIAGLFGSHDRKEILEKAVAELASEVEETQVLVRSESAWLAVVEEVLRQKIDVVFAAKRTSVQFDDQRLGSVARKLLRKCPCAVWLEDPQESRDPSTIVAATDLTPVGDRVVELSASVAHAFGAKLHVVHAFSLTMEVQLQGGEARREFEQQHHDTAVAHIEQVLATTPIAGAADVHVGLTSPTQAVLESIERLRPGLVVMGTVSRGGVPGLLTGNTAERLIDRIDCALLTIKPNDFVCPVTLT